MKPPQALINYPASPADVDCNYLQDFYLVVAANIEEALMQTGAVPGQDYTRLDLFQLAQPFVQHRFVTGESGALALFDAVTK